MDSSVADAAVDMSVADAAATADHETDLATFASSTTSAHHLGNHEGKLATLEIMFRAIRTRKIWPLASPRVVPKSVPNP